MKTYFETPDIRIIQLDPIDILTTSGGQGGDDDDEEFPPIPRT